MLHQQVDADIAARADWALRRQRGIPNNRRLWVLACMDERLPVEEALGIRTGDAHVFRNAGGIVTDDAIRSAMLTCNFFGTREIVVVNHTECGMMSATADQLVEALRAKQLDPAKLSLNPAVPELKLSDPKAFGKWIGMFSDVDATCAAQVELLRSHPLIPAEVQIHGYVYEVETGRLRAPHHILGRRVNTAQEMRA